MKSVSIKLFFHMYMDCSASVAPPLPSPTDFLLSSSDEAEMESLEEANPNLEKNNKKISFLATKERSCLTCSLLCA